MSIRLEARNRGNIRLDMDNASLAAKYAREAGAAEKAAELSAANAAGAAERADAAAEAALRAEAGAQSAAVHLPQPGENGTWLVWDQAGDSYVDSGENCTGVQGERGLKGDTGDKGDTGSKGDDGVSPTVTVTDITGGHRVTITDANHPQGQPFDVMDGEVAQEDFDELSGDVDDLKSATENYNAYNYLSQSAVQNKTSGGVTWERLPSFKIHVSSVSGATSTSLLDLWNVTYDNFPEWLVPGRHYKLEYSSENVYFRVASANTETGTSTTFFESKSNGEFTIPSDARKIIIRMAVSGGTAAFDEIVSPEIMNALSNSDLTEHVDRTDGIVVPHSNPNLFDNLDLPANKTASGITWAFQADGSVRVTGTIGATTFINLYNGALPSWLEAGKSYYLKYDSDYVRFRLLFKRDGTETSNTSFLETRSNDIITLPDQISNIIIRLAVSGDDSGVVVDDTIRPELYEYKPDNLIADSFEQSNENWLNSPSYYDDEIAATVNAMIAAETEPCLTFLWCTDLHYHSVIGGTVISDIVTPTCANMRKLAQARRFDGLICTGDIVDAKPPMSTAETRKQIDYVMQTLHSVGLPMIYVMGNHDDNRYIGFDDTQTKEPFTTNEIYGRYMSFVKPERTSDYTMDGLNYFVDFEQFKIRMIVLDSNYFASAAQNWQYGYSTKTVNWFGDQMTNIPADYSVIVLSHTSPVSANNVSGSYTNISSIYNAINTFIQNGGKYICTLYGHSHVDYSNTTPWLEITLGSGKAYNFTPDNTYPTGAVAPTRTPGTVSEQLFDVLIIKPNSKTIQTIRFGAGNDRQWTYQ